MSDTYIIRTSSMGFSSSGNAVISMFNMPESGKQISVKKISILANTILGQNYIANTLPAIYRLRMLMANEVSRGDPILLVKHDSNYPDLPLDIVFEKNTFFIPNYTTILPSTGSYTDNSVVVGSTTFTPSSSPGWVANEHRNAERLLFVSSGPNAGYYDIIANTATALTLSPPLPSAGATSGTIVEVSSFAELPYLNMLSTTGALLPFSSFTFDPMHPATLGSIFSAGTHPDQNAVSINPGEILAIGVRLANYNNPLQISGTITIDTTPLSVYSFSEFVYSQGDNSALISINNQVGSGRIVTLKNVEVYQIGDLNTPYFQLVPISSIDTTSQNDNIKKLTPIAFDSDQEAITDDILQVCLDTPIAVSGLPASYISEGSNAIPKGFNFLNSKDFLGPTYMNIFPEYAAFKSTNAAFYGGVNTGTFGSHFSANYDNLLTNEIVLNQGEGLAIVSAAESATGTVAIPLASSGSFDYEIIFEVSSAFTPTLTLIGLVPDSEVRILLSSDNNIELSGIESSGTSFSYTYEFEPNIFVDIIVHKETHEYIRIKNFSLPSTDTVLPIDQRFDRNYLNP